MRKVSITMVIVALVLPCCLNLEKIGCVIFAMAFMVGAFVLARKYAPDIFV